MSLEEIESRIDELERDFVSYKWFIKVAHELVAEDALEKLIWNSIGRLI